jgi:hypothetical protein
MGIGTQLHRVHGRCACGGVSYTCAVEDETCNCSCDLCRRSSGSAFQSWVNGDRRSLVVDGETVGWESSPHASRHGCARCGSPLFLFERDEPEVVEVCAGSIAAPDGIVSVRDACVEKRPRWSCAGGADGSSTDGRAAGRASSQRSGADARRVRDVRRSRA